MSVGAPATPTPLSRASYNAPTVGVRLYGPISRCRRQLAWPTDRPTADVDWLERIPPATLLHSAQSAAVGAKRGGRCTRPPKAAPAGNPARSIARTRPAMRPGSAAIPAATNAEERPPEDRNCRRAGGIRARATRVAGGHLSRTRPAGRSVDSRYLAGHRYAPRFRSSDCGDRVQTGGSPRPAQWRR